MKDAELGPERFEIGKKIEVKRPHHVDGLGDRGLQRPDLQSHHSIVNRTRVKPNSEGKRGLVSDYLNERILRSFTHLNGRRHLLIRRLEKKNAVAAFGELQCVMMFRDEQMVPRLGTYDEDRPILESEHDQRIAAAATPPVFAECSLIASATAS